MQTIVMNSQRYITMWHILLIRETNIEFLLEIFCTHLSYFIIFFELSLDIFYKCNKFCFIFFDIRNSLFANQFTLIETMTA